MTQPNIKVVASMKTLMILAKELAEANKSNDPVKIKEAELAYENYRQLCLIADEIQTHISL